VYRWVDHTAEVELEIEAGSEREVLEEAARALAELLGIHERAGERETRALSVTGPDRPALLAAWLEELVFLGEAEGFVAMRVNELTLSDADLSAVVAGVVGDPPPLVKAITYHRLAFEPSAAGYFARVVLDV
jgi:SHS2 domain-containing protein